MVATSTARGHVEVHHSHSTVVSKIYCYMTYNLSLDIQTPPEKVFGP